MNKLINTTLAVLGSALLAANTPAIAGIGEDYQGLEKPELMKRFPKPVGDVSGTVNADLTYVADHIAIRNLVSAYGHVLDDDYFDEFMAMFVKDKPVLQVSAPCWANFEIVGYDHIRTFVDTRFLGRINFVQGRHTMPMIHVASQTRNTATVRAQAALSTTPNDGKSTASLGRASYNFWLTKNGDQWKVNKLYIELDSPLKPHKLPPTTVYEEDQRSLCKTE
jgi:ketosteroid isomerase-like protein